MRRSASGRLRVAIFGLACVHLLAPLRSHAQDAASDVRRQIEASWRDFDSFECRSIERVEGQPGRADSTKTIDFAWRVEGRSSWSSVSQREGRLLSQDIREDGSRRTFVSYFDTPPKAIQGLRISSMRSTPGSYGDMMFSGLWMFLPGGKTIAAHLKGGASLVNAGWARSPRWTLKVQSTPYSFECLLDQGHQFLPRELTARSAESVQHTVVDRFEQANGSWYPAEGSTRFTFTKTELAPFALTFRLEAVAINQPIPSTRFRWTDRPDGIDVDDQIEGTLTSVGGKLARLKLLKQHPQPKHAPPTGEPIRVPADAAASRWRPSLVLIAVAVGAGGFGLYLRHRGV